MPRIKLVLEYDGTHYVGWQMQPNGPSIQGRLKRALQELVGAPVDVFAAGRTDSGVHAAGQVVTFDSPVSLPLRAYWMGLNGLLPDDVAVVTAEVVTPLTPAGGRRGSATSTGSAIAGAGRPIAATPTGRSSSRWI